MGDYLKPDMSGKLQEISVLGLAHVGDAVFELIVRTWLCKEGASTAKGLHGGAIALVSAKAQAAAAERILSELNEEELAVYMRGRNAHLSSTPRGSTYEECHSATGVETLFGYLYLGGKTERLNELFKMIVNKV